MKIQKTSLGAVLVALLAISASADPEESFTEFLEEGLDAATQENGGSQNPSSTEDEEKDEDKGKDKDKSMDKDKDKGSKGSKGKGKRKRFEAGDAAVEELEALVNESASQKGESTGAGQYHSYSERLAKTLAMLTPEQQARIFN